MSARVAALREFLAARFWVIPAACCSVAFVLGLVLPEVDERLADDVPLLFGGGPDGARSLLSAITTSMISVTGLVFSITVVVLQLASSQFSPRILRTFLSSRLTQLTLGVFTATFLYSIVVLRSVRGDEASGDEFVPQLSVTGSFVLVLASVGLFLAYIHHITQSIRVSNVVSAVGAEARSTIERVRGERDATQRDATRSADLPAGGPVSRFVHSPEHGVLVRVNADDLVELARQHGVQLDLLLPVGDFAAEGMPLVAVHGVADGLADQQVWAALALAPERTMEQDVAFGFRQLVDIAEKALSPGVNDPTTAVQALDEMHDLLRRLAAAPDPRPARRDDAGVARLVLPERNFAELLSLAFDEIVHYGADSQRVLRHIRRILDDLGNAALSPHLPAIAAMRRRVAAVAAAAGPGVASPVRAEQSGGARGGS